MVKPNKGQRTSDYQQALDDFGITQLLSRISKYSDRDFTPKRMDLKQPEIEKIAVLLIDHLSTNLKGAVLANYLYIIREREKQHRCWAIARILPGAKTYAIAHFFNRQDAEDRLRALRRYVPDGIFEIIFDPPE